MKVAVVLPRGFLFQQRFPNSIETVIRTLNRHSRFKGEMSVLADEGLEPQGDFNFVGLPANVSRSERTRACIAKLRELKPDLLELHQHALSAHRIARKLPGIPTIFYRHNFVRVPKSAFQRLRHRIRNRAFNAHIFVSDAAANDFLEYYPQRAAQVSAIPNALDFELWNRPDVPRERLIAYAGRTAPEKGFGAFCEALPKVLDAHPEWSAEIFGSTWDVLPQWRDRQIALLARFGDRVRLHADQPFEAVPLLMNRAAIVVVPTITKEAFGLSAVEALAGGAALVSSGRGGLREASGPHAVYVDPPGPEGLADAMSALIAEPERRERLGREGRIFARDHHGAQTRAAQLDDLRERVAAGIGPNAQQVVDTSPLAPEPVRPAA